LRTMLICLSLVVVMLGCSKNDTTSSGSDALELLAGFELQNDGAAICAPECPGKECGGDGCGGVCGKCPTATPFCQDGQCAIDCTTNCEGRLCGPDGCGGSCGGCADADSCISGQCQSISPCEAKRGNNSGCEFFAVDLDSAEEGWYDAQHAQFAVVASNIDVDSSADVTVTSPDGKTLSATLLPLTLHKFELPATWSLQGTSLGKNAFKISASRPIVAYQFNPLSNKVEVFSGDASLLLPSPALGAEYYVVTYKQYETTFRGYFTVVGVSPEPTEVTFTPTCNTLAGGGFPEVKQGQSYTVTIEQGDVLNIESNDSSGDLTGSHISANAPIAVFAGHEGTNTLDECCADHIEQQMLPVETWSAEYLVARSWQRWKEEDHVRIVAAYDGTEVTLMPNITEVPTLNAGDFYHFQTGVDIEISATKPIQVAQYLASAYEILGGSCPSPFTYDSWSAQCIGPDCSNASQCPTGPACETYNEQSLCAPIGDPAMILALAPDQFMDTYVFLTPAAYLQDYVNVIAPLNTGMIVLDDEQLDLAALVPVGMSGFGVVRLQVPDGVHRLWSDKPVGIIVYGYDNDVGYGYPGGMRLSTTGYR
jgi:hypothetical protein